MGKQKKIKKDVILELQEQHPIKWKNIKHIQFEDEYTFRPEVFELDGGQLKAKIRTFTPRVEWGMIWSR